MNTNPLFGGDSFFSGPAYMQGLLTDCVIFLMITYGTLITFGELIMNTPKTKEAVKIIDQLLESAPEGAEISVTKGENIVHVKPTAHSPRLAVATVALAAVFADALKMFPDRDTTPQQPDDKQDYRDVVYDTVFERLVAKGFHHLAKVHRRKNTSDWKTPKGETIRIRVAIYKNPGIFQSNVRNGNTGWHNDEFVIVDSIEGEITAETLKNLGLDMSTAPTTGFVCPVDELFHTASEETEAPKEQVHVPAQALTALKHASENKSAKAIGKAMKIQPGSAYTYLSTARKALRASSTREAIERAKELDLI